MPATRVLLLLAVASCGAMNGATHPHEHGRPPTQAEATSEVGFVVAAPDRGFLGNEEARDAFDDFARGRNAALVFVTDEQTSDDLQVAVVDMKARGARRVVVLPLFVSGSELRFGLLQSLVVQGTWPVPVTMGRRFGESYLAVELLGDRFRSIAAPAGRRVVVAGYGAEDAAARQRVTRDLQTIANAAAEGFGFASVQVVVWLDRSGLPPGSPDVDAETALEGAALSNDQVTVVPFQLGPKLDTMMSFSAALLQHLPSASQLVEQDITPDPIVGMWMAQEANRHVPLGPNEIGVVFLAHGADHRWNEGMRASIGPLANRYKIEFAFCMADPPLIERAIRKLEVRGARGIVVVRVFGLTSSFQGTVERSLGMDVEGTGRGDHADHTAHGHRQTMGALPTPRIRSEALLTTVGGVEDSPHFAGALLDRALSLAKNPERETVILVAHGSGDDATNDHWRHVLESVALQMRSGQGAQFRAIKVGTWREDWPDKRAPEVAAIRVMVEEASRDGGRAIVVPARTTAQGSERELLAGLDYELGTGFAPHPLFERWLEEQVTRGTMAQPATTADEVAHHH